MSRSVSSEPLLMVAERLQRFNEELRRPTSPFSCPDSSTKHDDDDDLVETMSSSLSRYDHGSTRRQASHKRKREASDTAGRTQRESHRHSTPPATPAKPVHIKKEVEIEAHRYLHNRTAEEVVWIYVGEQSATTKPQEIAIEHVQKSPVLRASVCKEGSGNPFIMHPALLGISRAHFQSVLEFLVMELYMPMLDDNPEGENVLPKTLEGFSTAQHYQDEAVRASHVYTVAKRLGLGGLQQLVYDMAMIVFSRPSDSEMMSNDKGKSKGHGVNEEGEDDILEE